MFTSERKRSFRPPLAPPNLGGEEDTPMAEKTEDFEEAEGHRAGVEGDSSCAHGIFDGNRYDQLFGVWPDSDVKREG